VSKVLAEPRVSLADFDSLPAALSVDELPHVVPLSRSAAYRAVRSGAIPSIRVGSRIVIPTARLKALIFGEEPPA